LTFTFKKQTKDYFLKSFWRYIYIIFSKIKSHKEVTEK
jgi:hypothetical protein